MSNLTDFVDPSTSGSSNCQLIASLSAGGCKRSARSISTTSYDNSMSIWTNDLNAPEPQAKGKANKKESHNRIERKRRDYINSQITCLGNLLPPELYRDVSEGKRNKGSVLRLSVNYITELQNTVSQIGSIQQENQLARQLIPLLVRRIKTLQKALADLVEAIPHCLDQRLDGLLEEVAAAAVVPEDCESAGGPRKRPRRLMCAFQQAKSQLGGPGNEELDEQTAHNQSSSSDIYEEEYQTWARLSEYNQKQEQLLSANTPGHNSTSTPCSVSSNSSASNNNNNNSSSSMLQNSFSNNGGGDQIPLAPSAGDLKLMYSGPQGGGGQDAYLSGSAPMVLTAGEFELVKNQVAFRGSAGSHMLAGGGGHHVHLDVSPGGLLTRSSTLPQQQPLMLSLRPGGLKNDQFDAGADDLSGYFQDQLMHEHHDGGYGLDPSLVGAPTLMHVGGLFASQQQQQQSAGRRQPPSREAFNLQNAPFADEFE